MSLIIWSIISFLFAIAILIAFHEYGHFLVARCFGVKVLRFSIGFGKPLLRYQGKSGTEYVLAAFPLGGYVKMLGETEGEGEVPVNERQFAFSYKPVWARIAIVIAGPAFNILFAIFAYWLMFSIGITSFAPIVGKPLDNSVASYAGMQRGDEIIAVDNQLITTWNDLHLAILSHLGEKGQLNITVKSAKLNQEKTYVFNLAHWKVDSDFPMPLQSLGIVKYVPDIPPAIAKVLNGSPAKKAGLQDGDQILSANGKAVRNWQELLDIINKNPGETLKFTLLRNNKVLSFAIPIETKISADGNKVGYLGIQSKPLKLSPDLIRQKKYSLFDAALESIYKTGSMMLLTFHVLYKMIMGYISVKTISGPIGIAQGAGITASLGFSYYLDFLGLISISLGILNILPIPLLDGGYLFYYIIELIKGKPASLKSQAMGLRIGIVILIGLTVLAFYNDIRRILL